MNTIYVESSLLENSRTKNILDKFSKSEIITCSYYGEIFNIKSQNFRLQKNNPSLIIAEKKGNYCIPIPQNHNIAINSKGFYFSHMLNCLYDCRYCFLQGMFRSANYVWFVNYEDFERDIDLIRRSNKSNNTIYFFSGYDCDSLALESITGFASHFINFFSKRDDIFLELRTKSINTKVLESIEAVPNIVIAYSLNPPLIAKNVENKAPSFESRIKKIKALINKGWKIGLRLDPLIPWFSFETLYLDMLNTIFNEIDMKKVHSVTIGPMRFPKKMYDRITNLYPKDILFSLEEMHNENKQMSYSKSLENKLMNLITKELLKHVERNKIFSQI